MKNLQKIIINFPKSDTVRASTSSLYACLSFPMGIWNRQLASLTSAALAVPVSNFSIQSTLHLGAQCKCTVLSVHRTVHEDWLMLRSSPNQIVRSHYHIATDGPQTWLLLPSKWVWMNRHQLVSRFWSPFQDLQCLEDTVVLFSRPSTAPQSCCAWVLAGIH